MISWPVQSCSVSLIGSVDSCARAGEIESAAPRTSAPSAALVVRLRGALERDYRTREIENIYGAEGTGRIGLALERLLAGLDTLGVTRKTAMEVVTSVAMDSAPPLRRAAYECVGKYSDVETADVAIPLGLPTNTVRRILEDLAAYGLVIRTGQGQGKADLWNKANWETP